MTDNRYDLYYGREVNIAVPAPPAMLYDAFGRQRVSEPFTLGDYKHLYGLNEDFITATTTSGTLTTNVNRASVFLNVAASTGSSVVHQSKKYHHYMPGKSQLIESSFNFGNAISGIVKRVGYFDKYSGIFLEQLGNGELAFNMRDYTTGTIDDLTNRVAKHNWNVDPCDGNGPSGFNLDITKSQIMFIDFQWLGVGRVRCGFIHNGAYVIAHEFYNSNNKDAVYITYPNLPVRCEIVNTTGQNTASFEQICSTVVSEGGYKESGIDLATSVPALRTVSAGQTLPILAIRLKNTFLGQENRVFTRLNDVDVLSTAQNIRYDVRILSAGSFIFGATWTSSSSTSAIEYSATMTGSTGGRIVNSGFISSGGVGSNRNSSTNQYFIPSDSKRNFIAQNYTSSDSEIFLVSVTNLGDGDTGIAVSMGWREIY